MLDTYYDAVLGFWAALNRYAVSGRLPDNSIMPEDIRVQILARYPVVLALVLRGKATPISDVDSTYSILVALGEQQVAFKKLSERFMVASVTRALAGAFSRGVRETLQIAHDAGVLPHPFDDPFFLGAGLGVVGLIGLGLGGLFLYASRR